MSKELEALEIIGKLYLINDEQVKDWDRRDFNILKSALNRLEAIDNANPSEALEETLRDIAYDLENDDNPFLRDRYYGLLDLKQALLKVQEPKQYLKWEDLEFTEENQTMEVLLNGVTYNICFYEFTIVGQNEVNIYTNGTHIVTLNSYYPEDIQFFNNLHLEVKE